MPASSIVATHILASDSPTMSSTLWHAWFDGTAAPNPGKLAAGVVIVSPSGERHEYSQVLGLNGCNNEAELHALALTLDLAWRLGANKINIIGDSKPAIDFVTRKDATTIVRLNTIIQTIQERASNFALIDFIWAPRHRNQEADQLARRALNLPPKISHKKKRRK